ncbi:phosphate ABC transporter permease subunit PstC [Plebeiibacterium marinum]|uniref:Phosphate transport system permease protein n=1 Tax=Plebeiibacterium marinum TaxID=2992111 RepID=A0AAE3SJP8_9BACT|nr:phosphate ABC transporter permease subunit PstC [Plebeiobacterium marinum]MCW3805704.1 phosphate ABC transporter permease subunit PstC [Plebeiobacterium marinum]
MKSDTITKYVLLFSSFIILLVSGGMIFSLLGDAVPVFEKFGWRFITSTDWNPTEGRESYGALPFIVGTLSTSILALLICLPMAFSTSLFIAEYFKKSAFSSIISSMVDLLAGVPSIVYGLWGFYTLRPFIVSLGLDPQGYGIFTSGLILAIMIIPYATSLSSEIIAMVPNELKEAAYALGATRMEVIFNVILPGARSGIIASFILAFGRALGETMAVTMLIGNANIIPTGLFSTGNSMASVIANQFGEADGLKMSALIAIGLLLFVITGVVNFVGKFIIKKLS